MHPSIYQTHCIPAGCRSVLASQAQELGAASTAPHTEEGRAGPDAAGSGQRLPEEGHGSEKLKEELKEERTDDGYAAEEDAEYGAAEGAEDGAEDGAEPLGRGGGADVHAPSSKPAGAPGLGARPHHNVPPEDALEEVPAGCTGHVLEVKGQECPPEGCGSGYNGPSDACDTAGEGDDSSGKAGGGADGGHGGKGEGEGEGEASFMHITHDSTYVKIFLSYLQVLALVRQVPLRYPRLLDVYLRIVGQVSPQQPGSAWA